MQTLFSLIFSCIFLLLLLACIQEIDPFGGSESPLIIIGDLTNETGPHRVRVMRSAGFNVRPNFEEYYRADVRIIDDMGNEELLNYRSLGYFYTSDSFRGEVGHSYRVRVTLASGETYESLPETMLPVPEVLEVKYTRNTEDVIFSIDYEDDPEMDNYYRWRFSGTYRVYSSQRLGLGDIFTIENCYPMIETHGISQHCWLTDFDSEFLKIESDRFYNGQPMSDVEIYRVDKTNKFNYGYNAKVSQYSLTERAYNYWAAIQSQINNTGTIFETSNYQIAGNLRSEQNPDELILGYFQVSAVQSKRVHVDFFEGDFEPLPCVRNESGCLPETCVTCYSYGSSATDQKPDYWPE